MTDTAEVRLHCLQLFPSHTLRELGSGYSLIPTGYESEYIDLSKEDNKWEFKLTSGGVDYLFRDSQWQTLDGKPASLTSISAKKVESLNKLLNNSAPPSDESSLAAQTKT